MGQQTQFTPREREISALLLQGKSNKQIALALGISVRTVEFHLSNIYAKLGATSRTEAALKLTESGLRESTGGELRESTVVETGKAAENGGKSFSQRRFLMKRPLLIGFGLLIVIAVLCVGAFFLFAPVRTETFAE
ncbi:MAG: response regulator transcription factor, partial [Candidatus Roizmanbacteria bacterium]|nr:response regulator transcription factor [Candidatus Roizmanbacteria bacterium]